MKTGKIEFAPDYESRSVARRLKMQGAPLCEWCGRPVKESDRRKVEIRRKVFKVCPSCPPPRQRNRHENVAMTKPEDLQSDKEVVFTELERAVILAAIARRMCERHFFPMGAPDSGHTLLNRLFIDEQQAVDALLKARRR